jgi:hypothetical protein
MSGGRIKQSDETKGVVVFFPSCSPSYDTADGYFLNGMECDDCYLKSKTGFIRLWCDILGIKENIPEFEGK